MAGSSKSGNAAQALQRHLDQDRSAHAGIQNNRTVHSTNSFRNSRNPDALQLADEQYAREQMARMGLEDVDLTSGLAFQSGLRSQHTFPTQGTQLISSGVSAGGNTSLSVQDFLNMQSAAQRVAMNGSSVGARNVHPAASQMSGRQYMGSTLGAQRYAPIMGAQTGFTPGYLGHNPSMAQGHFLPQAGAQSSSTQINVQPDQTEIAAAWEASFEDAMSEWVTTQNDLETESTVLGEEDTQMSTAEATQDRPLNSSELARAAQQLVNAVSDNDSEKFRNSNFVDLMRRIAAREVIVENNSLVETDPAATEAETNTGNASFMTSSLTAKDKGKGKAVAAPATTEDGELSP